MKISSKFKVQSSKKIGDRYYKINALHFGSHDRGFTLIEILVTIFIFSIIGLTASNSLFSLLRGAANIEVAKELKQNGDYALSVMEQRIRNAKEVTSTCIDTGTVSTSITIENQDTTSSSTTYTCDAASGYNRIREGTSNYLTNTKVRVRNCSIFTCTSDNGTPNEILIDFQLEQQPLVANSPSQQFTSKISLRNK